MAIGAQTMSSLFKAMYEDWYAQKGRVRERQERGLSTLEDVADLYGPGYMAGQERKALTAAKSALSARGLGGSTRPGAVSAGMKAGFEDVRRAGRAGAMTNIADYLARFQEDEADPSTLVHLATGGFSGMMAEKEFGLRQETAMAGGVPVGGGRTYGRTFGASSFPDEFSIAGEAGAGGGGVSGGAGGSYTSPGGSYGGVGTMAGAADVQMGTLGGATYFGAGGSTPTAGGAGDDTAAYNNWATEMRRRYPGKPVMPMSRWLKTVKPKMGGGAETMSGTISAGMGATGFPGMKL